MEKKPIYEEFAELNEDPSYFLDLRLIPNRLNHEATIAFFCHNFLDFFALKETVKRLEKAEFVLAPAMYKVSSPENTFYYNVLIRRLNKEQLPWRLFIPQHYTLHQFFTGKYSVLLSRRRTPFFRSPEVLLVRKLLLIDADLPLALTGIDSTSNADLVLLPGPTSKYPVTHFGNAEDVGISRFDFLRSTLKAKHTPPQFLYIAGSLAHAAQFAATLPIFSGKIRDWHFSIYLPALPHGNALPPKSLDLYRKTVHELETADITIFHENEDPYALIPHADLVMIDSGYFLYDLLFHEIPFIFFETQFATTLTEYRSFLQPNSWREFQQRDPQQLPGAPILQNLINLPDEMQRARDNRESVQETLRGLKHAFLSDHVGKSTDRLIEAVIGASLEEPPAENLLSRIVNNDLSNPKQFRKDVAFE